MFFFRNLVIALSLVFFTASPAFAQFSIIPYTATTNEDCKSFMGLYNSGEKKLTDAAVRNEILACGIKTGMISLEMVPFYLTYISNFLLGLIGLISVLFIVIGGYQYIFGALGENKDKGKKTITHALMGMSLAILSWIIVNIVITAITS